MKSAVEVVPGCEVRLVCFYLVAVNAFAHMIFHIVYLLKLAMTLQKMHLILLCHTLSDRWIWCCDANIPWMWSSFNTPLVCIDHLHPIVSHEEPLSIQTRDLECTQRVLLHIQNRDTCIIIANAKSKIYWTYYIPCVPSLLLVALLCSQ